MDKKRIIIVDDEEQIRFCISMILQMKGYETFSFDNGEDALRAIVAMHQASQQIDLLISDIKMPKLSGEDLITKLNQLNLPIPILAITGFGEKELVIRLMRLGCRDFIDKPFDLEELSEHVDLLIHRSNSEIIERKRKDQLARLGETACSIIHDLNNLLCGTQGYADLALEKLESPHPAREIVERLVAGNVLVNEQLGKLLAIKRGGPTGIKTKNDCRAIVRKVADILRIIAPPSIEIKTTIPGQRVWWKADGDRIQQALFNLGLNGLDAMPEGGVLELSLLFREITADNGSSKCNLLCLTVSDTGIGISKENLSKILTESFTTKSKGNGYGLSIVKAIVEDHKGWIEVRSDPGKGSMFQLCFPRTS